MGTETRPIRFGLAAREAANLWQEQADRVITDEATSFEVEKAGDLTWTWSMGDVENGRLEFHDRGEGRGEARLEVERSDGSAGERIDSIVTRLSAALTQPGLDPPVVARDPHQGEPPEAATDPDQPL